MSPRVKVMSGQKTINSPAEGKWDEFAEIPTFLTPHPKLPNSQWFTLQIALCEAQISGVILKIRPGVNSHARRRLSPVSFYVFTLRPFLESPEKFRARKAISKTAILLFYCVSILL